MILGEPLRVTETFTNYNSIAEPATPVAGSTSVITYM